MRADADGLAAAAAETGAEAWGLAEPAAAALAGAGRAADGLVAVGLEAAGAAEPQAASISVNTTATGAASEGVFIGEEHSSR